MIKRILLSILAIAIVVPAGGLAYLYLRKPATAPPSGIKVAMTPERIARGQYLFEVVADCDGCHSQRDFTRIAGPVVPAGRGRGVNMSELVAELPGMVVARNITPDTETGLGAWTDGEKIRAIREGIGRDGRALFPMMPYGGFRRMSDEDVESVVAYMNTLTPVRYPLPVTKLDFPLPLMIKSAPQPAGTVPPPDRSDRLKYGEYLVTVAGCGGCHTPAERGAPIAGKEFAGGEKFAAPAYGTVYSANITPDRETGIGKWDEEFFVKKFYDYREYAEHGPPAMTNPEQFTVMPWLTLCRLSREDLGAIYTYLMTLKPVRNAVETHPKKA
jgi:mono/diheme cytochrome c family protein